MKKITFLLIILVFPFAGICQENADLEKEKAAIKTVIEKETNAWINLDYENWKNCYTQDEPFARLNSTPDYWGGANNWANYDLSLKTFYQNFEGPGPQQINNKNENYLIRVFDDAAWAVFIENAFDNEGIKTGWNVNTRFLEKHDGDWKISYVGWLNAGLYERGGENLQTARMLCYNNIIAGIEFAKSQGVSVEDYAKHQGEKWKMVWDPAVGFDGLVDFTISSWTSLAEGIQVLNQTENNAEIKVTGVYPEFKTQGEMLGVTYDDLMVWFQELMIPISNYLGCNFTQVMTEDGVKITIVKN